MLGISAILLASAGVGGLRHQVAFWRISPTHLLNGMTGKMQYVRLRGTIVTEPRTADLQRGKYSIPMGSRRQTSFVLLVSEVETTKGWNAGDGLVRVRILQATPSLTVGDRIESLMRVRTINGPGNPGQFDWQTYYRRNGIYLSATIDQKESVTVVQPASLTTKGVSGLLTSLRRRCRDVLLDDVAAETPEAGLLASYVAGHRWSMSKQVDEAFRRSGTAHILAVSGSHVIMIGTFGMIIGMLLFRRLRQALMVGLGCVLFFGVFVEPNPAALRSHHGPSGN